MNQSGTHGQMSDGAECGTVHMDTSCAYRTAGIGCPLPYSMYGSILACTVPWYAASIIICRSGTIDIRPHLFPTRHGAGACGRRRPQPPRSSSPRSVAESRPRSVGKRENRRLQPRKRIPAFLKMERRPAFWSGGETVQATMRAVQAAKALVVRAGPALESEKLRTLPQGTPLIVVEDVQLEDGTQRARVALEGCILPEGWVSLTLKDGSAAFETRDAAAGIFSTGHEHTSLPEATRRRRASIVEDHQRSELAKLDVLRGHAYLAWMGAGLLQQRALHVNTLKPLFADALERWLGAPARKPSPRRAASPRGAIQEDDQRSEDAIKHENQQSAWQSEDERALGGTVDHGQDENSGDAECVHEAPSTVPDASRGDCESLDATGNSSEVDALANALASTNTAATAAACVGVDHEAQSAASNGPDGEVEADVMRWAAGAASVVSDSLRHGQRWWSFHDFQNCASRLSAQRIYLLRCRRESVAHLHAWTRPPPPPLIDVRFVRMLSCTQGICASVWALTCSMWTPVAPRASCVISPSRYETSPKTSTSTSRYAPHAPSRRSSRCSAGRMSSQRHRQLRLQPSRCWRVIRRAARRYSKSAVQ
jgi:hypothetical protein